MKIFKQFTDMVTPMQYVWCECHFKTVISRWGRSDNFVNPVPISVVGLRPCLSTINLWRYKKRQAETCSLHKWRAISRDSRSQRSSHIMAYWADDDCLIAGQIEYCLVRPPNQVTWKLGLNTSHWQVNTLTPGVSVIYLFERWIYLFERWIHPCKAAPMSDF